MPFPMSTLVLCPGETLGHVVVTASVESEKPPQNPDAAPVCKGRLTGTLVFLREEAEA